MLICHFLKDVFLQVFAKSFKKGKEQKEEMRKSRYYATPPGHAKK